MIPSEDPQLIPGNAEVCLDGQSMVCWDDHWELSFLEELLTLFPCEAIDFGGQLSPGISTAGEGSNLPNVVTSPFQGPLTRA